MNPKHEDFVEGKYLFKNLADIKRLHEQFLQFTGFISYPNQELLMGIGWRDIYTKFYLLFLISEVNYKVSNLKHTSQLKESKAYLTTPKEVFITTGKKLAFGLLSEMLTEQELVKIKNCEELLLLKLFTQFENKKIRKEVESPLKKDSYYYTSVLSQKAIPIIAPL